MKVSQFTKEFIRRNDISFVGMRNTALSLLPKDKTVLDGLYNDLRRGTDILDDETHLNMYLRSFGQMHKAKLDAAFSCLPDIQKIFSDNLEIYDWGCGQGTATICLLDYLNKKGVSYSISQINLIEPSIQASTRAEEVISCFDNSIKIKTINKVFDDLNEDDFSKSNSHKIHLFSNILDVDAFDLAQFTVLFQSCFWGTNHFICVGPYYSNNKRVDDFIVATEPDIMYAISNKEKGMWLKDWTISLRVFFKDFTKIENIQDIRKRIEESHKSDQFFAGYILDSTSEEYFKSDIASETESLYNSLSAFDVKSNKSLDISNERSSKLAVLVNILSRGLPTRAPIELERLFSLLYHTSVLPEAGALLNFKSTHKFSKEDINEALHIIDPRFNLDYYNGDMLESSFEKNFISNYLNDTESNYLIQILEPQRPLSTIVNIPDKRFTRDQRVDFAIEIPYGKSKTGFIIELDGAPYHSNIFQKIRDEKRDNLSSKNGWDTYRIENLKDYKFLHAWESESETNKYLSLIKSNARKKIEGRWKELLEVVLSPLAIARIERMILQAMLTGDLNLSASEWNILVIERDVPCAAIAINLIKESFEKISELDGSKEKLPEVKLSIVTTDEFKDSPLHLGRATNTLIPSNDFDLCLDISMLLRDNVDALPLNVNAETIYIIRSSHYAKKQRTICSAPNIIYPPFVEKDATGTYISIKEREDVLTYFLQNIFRKPGFRPGQLPILSHTLSDKTTIGLLPTGGGKSLTYQLSSLLQPGVTIVVDPLVSLMVDQVRGLHDNRIDSSDCVNSGMDGKEKAKKLNLLQNGALQFMFLSPERYMMENFRESLITMTEKNNIYFAYGVIDEVHCVSEWGHDFRTSYLHLGRNMINYMKTKSGRPLSIIGLTATASFDVLADVERELTLGGNLTIDSETIVRPENDSRPELTYRIINVESDFDSIRDENIPCILKVNDDWAIKDVVAESKKRRMLQLIHEIPIDLQDINCDNSSDASCYIEDYSTASFYNYNDENAYDNAGIIFCPHAQGTFGVMDNVWGTRSGISTYIMAEACETLEVGTFVGGDKPTKDMKTFNENGQNLMIATKAFGMGIDKPNVRFTIHLNHPSSIEHYVQEAGRGGRDKKHAISYVLYDSTEYIHFTIDKINDIRFIASKYNGFDPVWLESYVNKFVLRSDLISLCRRNSCSEENAGTILSICKEKGFIENVDKNIDLWFHNNSFRGLYKEKVVLLEMTDRILNVKPGYIQSVQGQLIDETGNSDIVLKLDVNKNAIKVLSQDNTQNQYGYIFLDTLQPTYRYVNFELDTCQYICNTLVAILQTIDDYSARALMRPIEGTDNQAEGIYSAMSKADSNGYVFVTVTWENQIHQDFEGFENTIKNEIKKIAMLEDPSINKTQWQDINEQRYGKLKLNKIATFDDLIAQISKCSGDVRWLRYHSFDSLYRNLKQLFYQKRDKDDTDKAIYRMCCIGLVEDVTIDYLSQTYELKIRKRTDDEFKQFMLEFFKKYYSHEQALKKVKEIDKQKGRNYLDKCLGYLTAFVYENLEKKRFRAIEDMRIACEDSIANREATHDDNWLKEFIHLYFNSKYARVDYEVNGEDYSLSKDTDRLGRCDFEVVLKYINVISKDNSGSEVDNIKHLYGATLLCLRAHTDNAALLLLLSYCINFLGAGNNKTLQDDAIKGYIQGFMSLYQTEGSKIWEYIDLFNELLALKCKEKYMKENLIKRGKETIMLLVHEEKFNNITRKYLK